MWFFADPPSNPEITAKMRYNSTINAASQKPNDKIVQPREQHRAKDQFNPSWHDSSHATD